MIWFALFFFAGIAFWVAIAFIFGLVALACTLAGCVLLIGALLVISERGHEEFEDEDAVDEVPPLRRELPRERRAA